MTSDYQRLRELQQADNRQAARSDNVEADSFLAAITCPPSTQIWVRGGFLWQGTYGGDGVGWRVSSATFDLADEEDTGASIIFASPDHYIGVVLALYQGAYPGEAQRLRLHWDGVEYATAAEAEDAADAALYSQSPAFEDYPLALAILRNSGDTASPNQFQPVDAVNRGRSYLWRDVRPLQWL